MEGLIKERLPRHVAIIMDGNGRWARQKSLNRIEGHIKGIEAVRAVVTSCRELGIKFLTLYAFSIENWRRPGNEISALMGLLQRYLREELDEMLENNIRLKAIGDLDSLPRDAHDMLIETVEKTTHCDAMVLILALSYGGRDEIIRAVRRLIVDAKNKKIRPDQISEETFPNYLSTKDIPDPDLLIRTSGEYRISNFLLWQMAYTEIYVTKTLWPDFRKEDLIKALLNYQRRQRRFGLTSEQLAMEPG
ncbi:MAG: isoprenyl transferase [Syntrophobacterales bacterium]|nr:MAG: isoprenyl transferase [Syntrophobacterales bacterium]